MQPFFVHGNDRYVWRIATTVISFLTTRIPDYINNIINKTPITIHTRIPLPLKSLKTLHLKNINIIKNFCFKHQIPIPSTLHTLSLEAKHNTNPLPINKSLLKLNSPLNQVIQYIKSHNIILTQSDKTPHLCLFHREQYIALINAHLHNENTYLAIPSNRVNAIDKYITKHILTLYKNLHQRNPPPSKHKQRSFKILPKLHKPIHSWPNFPNKPKTRPIVNDSSSITTRAYKTILPYLQTVEKRLPHTCLSSIQVIHKLQLLSRLIDTQKYFIITADINDMYTNIHTPTLLDILNTDEYNFQHKQTILSFLQHTMKYTTFLCNKTHYLQKQGLPMGGPLSGTLANIYVSHFEKDIMSKFSQLQDPPYLFRYIDDILILTPNLSIATQIITDLSRAANLQITSTPLSKHANFLDITIILHNTHVTTSTFYKFASPISRSFFPNQRKETKILCSQLLRVWRLNNDDAILTGQIEHVISFLNFQHCPLLIITALRSFLSPVLKPNRTYSASHLLCPQCFTSSLSHKINISKMTTIGNTLLTSRGAFNCLSICTTILCRTKLNNILFLSPLTTLHDTISNYTHLLHEITPIGNITQFNKNKLFEPVKHLLPANTIQPHDYDIPIHIFPILRNASNIYGIKTNELALKKLTNIQTI
jgi:hypothetical protein